MLCYAMQDQLLSKRLGPCMILHASQDGVLMEAEQLQGVQCQLSSAMAACTTISCNDRHQHSCTIGIMHSAKTAHLVNIKILPQILAGFHNQLGLLLACDIALTQSPHDAGHRYNVALGGWALTFGGLSCSQWCLTWSPWASPLGMASPWGLWS